jgi:ATP-dependent RNA helicase SUPV3L1/SUV3
MKTRKAWKKAGRRIPQGTPPAQVEEFEGHHGRRLFTFEQTISEEEHLLSQAEVIAGHCREWSDEWQQLENVQLEQLLANLPNLNGPEAESGWLDLIRERERLVERRMTLAVSAKKLEIDLPLATIIPWREAMVQFNEHRFFAAISEAGVDNEPLAREIDKKLAAEGVEQRSELHPAPFWKYFGRFHKSIESISFELEVAEATRIREFHALFPARKMSRRFTLYLGPTNSGKTYQALQRLKDAPTGVYLAPLRLLALEVSETLQEWGVPCSMITGEERIEVAGANHTASTIEMLSLHKDYDICVIDEAQMLGDADRGWAWTQAILGAQAQEVCVIAAPEARPAIEKLLKLTGDPFEVVDLQRLSPLELLRTPTKGFADVEPGTAIVAFSRSGVLALKGEMERQTGDKVAVLYGALPPEVRRFQAAMFASGEAPYLIATDAIGMGLNLPIKTLLFSQDSKFYNHKDHPLTPMEVRQIGGRAGRFGKNEVGYIGSFRIGMSKIARTFVEPPATITRAHLAPNLDHLQAISELSGTKRSQLARLLFLFSKAVKPDPSVYKLADLDDQIVLARVADRYRHLDLTIRFILSAAPVPLRATLAVTAYERMVAAVAQKRKLSLSKVMPEYQQHERGRLSLLETATRIVNLYSWLHYRFPDLLPDIEQAQRLRRELNQQINVILGRQGPQARHCSSCSVVLPAQHKFNVCDKCHGKRKGGRSRGFRGRDGQHKPSRRGGGRGRRG